MRCHRCQSETEVWKCYGCGEHACEDCFTPQSPMSTDPETNCLTCTGDYEYRERARLDREWQRAEADRKRKDARNAAARRRYWKPENITKRRHARAEMKRLRAEQALKNLVETFKIVGGMMR